MMKLLKVDSLGVDFGTGEHYANGPGDAKMAAYPLLTQLTFQNYFPGHKIHFLPPCFLATATNTEI